MSDSRGRFYHQIAQIVHDLREPVNGMVGMASVLSESTLDDQQRELVSGINESGDILVSLINELLDAAQIESGAFITKPVDFDVHVLTGSLNRLMSTRCRRKGLQFDITVDRRFPRRIHGDFERIRQILLSLLYNSYKYTLNGRILLTLSVSEGQQDSLQFRIADTGIGMDEATLGSLFEPFSRSDDPEAQAQSGHGLGMSICKMLANQLDGDIVARSQAGIGSEFCLTLPFVAADEARDAQRDQHASLNDGLIVIEDTENGPGILSTQIRGITGLQHLTLSGFSNLEAHIETLGQDRPQIVVWVNAERLETAETTILARYGAFPQIRWVYYTHAGQRGDVARAEAMGFDAYISAPISNKLVTRCHNYFRERDNEGIEDTGILTRFQLDAHFDKSVRSLHALIVDDEPFNGKMMSIILDNLGHTSESVVDASEMIQRLSSSHFDVIFMDQQLTGVLGTDIAHKLANHPAYADIPVIIVSGTDCDTEETRKHIFSFLDKPVNIQRVRGQLERLDDPSAV